MRPRRFIPIVATILTLLVTGGARGQRTAAAAVPRTWDDQAIARLEVPLANPIGSPKHVSADYVPTGFKPT